MLQSFEATICRVREALERPLPGPPAHRQMAPLHDAAADRAGVAGRDCREAGVLALLVPRDHHPHVVLTVRHLHLPDHPGQVSFPGGRRENGEPLLQTALREAQEEVNLNPAHVEVLGALTPLYIPPSNYCVFPFIAHTRSEPDLTPHDREVDRIVPVPLTDLMTEGARREEVRTLRGERVLVPYFAVSGLQIWGATAMMLSEVTALLSD